VPTEALVFKTQQRTRKIIFKVITGPRISQWSRPSWTTDITVKATSDTKDIPVMKEIMETTDIAVIKAIKDTRKSQLSRLAWTSIMNSQSSL
jgi:hypothetical protein